MEIEKSEVGGTAALQLTTQPPLPPEGAAAPSQARILEFFNGPGGKMLAWIVPADEHTVIVGYVNKERLQRTIAAIKEGKPDLTSDDAVAKSMALLPANAMATAYVSPRGAIDFAQRLAPLFRPAEAPPQMTLPEFPKTPPIAFAVTTATNELRTHLAIPVEVLRPSAHMRGRSWRHAAADRPARRRGCKTLTW